jgi:hypothetical protein
MDKEYVDFLINDPNMCQEVKVIAPNFDNDVDFFEWLDKSQNALWVLPVPVIKHVEAAIAIGIEIMQKMDASGLDETGAAALAVALDLGASEAALAGALASIKDHQCEANPFMLAAIHEFIEWRQGKDVVNTSARVILLWLRQRTQNGENKKEVNTEVFTWLRQKTKAIGPLYK